MDAKEMIEELESLKDFIENKTVNTGIICLYNTSYNREFIEFAKSMDEYKHLKIIIHNDDVLPRNGIRMRDIDDVIRLRKLR